MYTFFCFYFLSFFFAIVCLLDLLESNCIKCCAVAAMSRKIHRMYLVKCKIVFDCLLNGFKVKRNNYSNFAHTAVADLMASHSIFLF